MSQSTIDSVIQAAIASQTPGMAVAVIHQGEIQHSQGYGLANLEWSCPVTLTTVFHLASLTKPFTALAIVLLAEQGRLRLDAPITTYLPEYPTYGETIKLIHLLTHTSGIPNYVTQPSFWEQESRNDREPAQLPGLFQQLPLDFVPGTRYRYSNSAYCLLGLIIEAVAGMSYADYLHEAIFAPLGMRDTRLMTHDDIIPQRAAGYENSEGVYCHAPYMSMTLPYASGSLGSTLEDLIRWDAGMREYRLIDHITQERMWAPLRLNNGREEGYGLGWGISHYRGHKAVYHSGGVPGFSTFYGHFVDDDFSVIVLTNGEGFQGDRLARQITDLTLQLPAPERTPVTLGQADIAPIVGTYTGDGDRHVKVTARNGIVHIQALGGTLDNDLTPFMQDRFWCLTSHGDVEVQFTDRNANGYQRLTVQYPFYWYNVQRDEERMIGML